MQNKSIKALIIGLSLLPSLAFASDGGFFNFNFHFLDSFNGFITRVFNFRRGEHTSTSTATTTAQVRIKKEDNEGSNKTSKVKSIEKKVVNEVKSWGRGDDEGEGDDREEGGDDRGSRNGSTGTVITTPTPTQPAPTTSTGTTVNSYTMAQVATHNNAGSCWSVVNGGVYDLTSWIGQHPGGASAILGICGIDASSAFNGQHGGQARPASELAGFKIGVLK